jgi:SAM-dependent methyltransferase
MENGQSSWDKLWSSRKRPYVYQNVVETAERCLAGVTGKSILEVGCGRGATLLEFAKRGANVVGLDYSEQALALCRSFEGVSQRSGRSVFLKGDARELPFADDSFDLVYSIGLVEHFRDPGLLLAEQYRVLRPDGILFVQVPQKYTAYTVIKKMVIQIGKWPYGGWETQFAAGELSKLVTRAGFDLQLCYGYGSFTLAVVRHLIAPALDYGKMWNVGLNPPWLRAIKARVALDVCVAASKCALPGRSGDE